MNRLSNKCITLAFLLCLCSTLYSYYMELVQKLNPCVLCVVERYIFIFLTGLLLLRLIIVQSKLLHVMLGSIVILGAALGIFVCFHHYRLQSSFVRGEFISCSLPIGLYYQQNSLSQFIKHILYENIECARSSLYLFGANILFLEIILFFMVLTLTMLTFLKDNK